MTKQDFEAAVAEIGLSAVPEQFRDLVRNVVFIVESEPSEEIRRTEGLEEDETLLGLYAGIPQTARGSDYGIGMTFPDTITLFQTPIEEEAEGVPIRIREVIRETIWHEVAHYFGLDHGEISKREAGK
jgi:predicted Zn-dependent protease with MMP-like domain